MELITEVKRAEKILNYYYDFSGLVVRKHFFLVTLKAFKNNAL